MELIEKIKSGGLDEADLLEYVTDNDITIAIAVAGSAYATEPILDIAAHDADARVRSAALNNPNIGKETIQFLCSDRNVEIANQAKIMLRRGEG